MSLWPRVAQQGAEAEVVAVALYFNFSHLDGFGHAVEGRDCVRAHDLRRDEEMDAVDHPAGEQSGVQAGSGFGEDREDVFFAEFVEKFVQWNSICFGR